MLRPSTTVAFALILSVNPAWPTAPPPPATFEQEICLASHVIIGRTKNVRFVNVGKVATCAGEPATSGGFLTICGSAEVDVEVEEVLYPKGWTPAGMVLFQFGGGYFSLETLKRDLEGNRYLLHTLVRQTEPQLVLGPSYPWVLGKSPGEKQRVEQALQSCQRP